MNIERNVIISEKMFNLILNKLDLLQNTVNSLKQEISNNHIKLTSQMDYLEIMLRRHQEGTCNEDAPVENADNLKGFRFPLQSIEEIENLEMAMTKDNQIQNALVSKFSAVAGTDGKKNGSKVAYAIVDEIFCKDALKNYSWTGISKDKEMTKKIAFSKYKCIIMVIFEVIRKADDRWTQKDTEILFKNGILKHAKKRSLREEEKLTKIQNLYDGLEVQVSGENL